MISRPGGQGFTQSSSFTLTLQQLLPLLSSAIDQDCNPLSEAAQWPIKHTRNRASLPVDDLGKLVGWRGHVTRTWRVMLQHVFENILDSHELISMQLLLDCRVVWTFSRALFVKDYLIEHSIGLDSYWTQTWFTCCFYWCLSAILSQSPYGSATDETVTAYESRALIVNAVSIDWHTLHLWSLSIVQKQDSLMEQVIWLSHRTAIHNAQ